MHLSKFGLVIICVFIILKNGAFLSYEIDHKFVWIYCVSRAFQARKVELIMIKIMNLSYMDILADINVNFNKGIIYIKGENGSGKSTLLDCISKLNRNYKGTIECQERIIYLNQNLYFSNRLKSKDFVEFLCKLENVKDYKKSFFTYLNGYGIENTIRNIWNKAVGKISRGERMMLFFLAFTYLNSDWYILDEPFAGVDTQNKKCMLKIINSLSKNGKGIIITSHEDGFLNNLEQKDIVIYSLSNGKLVDKLTES